MKILVQLIVFLTIAIFGLIGTSKNVIIASKLNTAQISSQTVMSTGELKVVKSVTQVKRGGIGFITIQGRPGTIYTVRSSFRAGNTTYNVRQWRRANRNGQATFVWHVGPETIPGNYSVTISGDGKTLNLNHNVIQ